MLHRPYIRQEVRQEVENRAQKNNKGQFLDANTHKPIDGKYDLGHKPGHEFWREAEKAEKEGLTQEQFNNRMNNPDLYHIENPHENRSHSHEMPKTQTKNNTSLNENISNKGENPSMEKNGFLESIKADKATIDRCNEVSKKAAKNMNSQSGKKGGLDNGGRERGDTGPMSHGREGGNKGGSAPAFHSSSGEGHSSNGQGGSPGHSSGGQASSSGHSSGSTGTGGHGSGGQGGGGHGSSSGGHGGH